MAKGERTPALLTRRELAAVLSRHPMTIVKWDREGLPVAKRGGRGRASLYDLKVVKAWLEAREAARSPEDVRASEARAQRDMWHAKLAEQTYRLRAAELLPAGDVERAWGAIRAAMRGHLVRLAGTWARRLERGVRRGEGVAGVQRELEDAVHATLLELSQLDVTKLTRNAGNRGRRGHTPEIETRAAAVKKKGRKR